MTDTNTPVSKIFESTYIGYNSLKESIEDCEYNSQAEALARLLAGENVFLSGPAGSGKSEVLKTFVDRTYLHNPSACVALTASTGAAATLIGGQTLHSWGQIPFDEAPFSEKTKIYQKFRQAVALTETIIIDEISMIPSGMLDYLDVKIRAAKNTDLPFGGIQVVFVGDFMQLPPVRKNSNIHSNKQDEKWSKDFAIHAESWKAANVKYCFLDKVHRTKDPKLQKVLNDIVSRTVTDETYSLLDSRLHQFVEKQEKDNPTDRQRVVLHTTNSSVDEINFTELEKIDAPEKKYKSIDAVLDHNVVRDPKKFLESMYRDTKLSRELKLKVGAKVMIIKNIITPQTSGDEYIANGTMGVVENLTDTYVHVRLNPKEGETKGELHSIQRVRSEATRQKLDIDEYGRQYLKTYPVAYIDQFPLRLGYAITVHKSQGQTFDGVITDLVDCFTPGLGYVALSRVKNLESLKIIDYSDQALEMSDESFEAREIVLKGAKKTREETLKNLQKYENILSEYAHIENNNKPKPEVETKVYDGKENTVNIIEQETPKKAKSRQEILAEKLAQKTAEQTKEKGI